MITGKTSPSSSPETDTFLQLLFRLLFAGCAWGAFIAYSREFAISQVLKKDSYIAIGLSYLTGIEFHQGETVFILLYIFIVLLIGLALAASMLGNLIMTAVFVTTFLVCVILDAYYLKQKYALALGVSTVVSGAIYLLLLILKHYKVCQSGDSQQHSKHPEEAPPLEGPNTATGRSK